MNTSHPSLRTGTHGTGRVRGGGASGPVLLLAALLAGMPLLVVEGADLPYKHLAFVGLALLGGAQLLVDAWRGRPAPRLGTPLDYAMGAWLLLSALSLVTARNPGLARYELLTDVALGLTFLLGVKAVRRPDDVRLLGLAVLTAAAFVSVFGLAGYQRWIADGSPEAARLAYLATPFFPHPYLAGQYVLPALVGGVVFLTERRTTWRRRLLLALMLAPSVAYAVVIGSRGALLAAGVALVTAALLAAWSSAVAHGGRGRPVVLAARAAGAFVAALVLLVVLRQTGVLTAVEDALARVPALGHAVRALGDTTDRVVLLFDVKASGHNYSRLAVWKDALVMSADHSLLGVGRGGFDSVFPSYHASEQSIPHAHNAFVHALAETGVMGLLALLFVVRHGRRAVVRAAVHLAGDEERRPLLLAASAALVTTLVLACFETPLLWPESGACIMVALGLVSRAGCTRPDAVSGRAAQGAAAVLVVAALALSGPLRVDNARAWKLSSDARVAMDRAVEAELAGRPEAAAPHWQAALDDLTRADALFPHRPDHALVAAQVAAALGRDAEADAWTRVADLRRPGAPWQLAAIGLHALREGRAEDAIESLRKASVIDSGPSGLETRLRLARAYRLAQHWDEAAAVCLSLIEDSKLHSRHPVLLLEAADILLASERDIERAKTYERMYRSLVPVAEQDAPRLQRLQERIAGKEERTAREIERVAARDR